MAGFIEGIHRNQRIMFPETVDEYIGDDNPVRFIDAFVESLDLEALGFERAVPKETERPRVIFEENSGLTAVIPIDFVQDVVKEAP